MRLIWLARGDAVRDAEGSELPAPIAATVCHVDVQTEIVPARGEVRPCIEPPCSHDCTHLHSGAEREAVSDDIILDRGEGVRAFVSGLIGTWLKS